MSASTTSTTRSRLVPMRARDPHEPGRTASSLELFFDLVFVVAVSIAAVQLHHALTEDHVLPGLLSYAFLFFAIWWAWMNFTWFATSFDTDDWLYRGLTILQMVGVLVLAAGVEPAFTGADYTSPGALDYVNFLRATQLCTNDVREKAIAFERAVFNVAFNNRDDHPKTFAYIMSASGTWTLAPAYDVTFCEGPGGYHQMDVMGEALAIDRKALLRLADEAEVAAGKAAGIIDGVCDVASRFRVIAEQTRSGLITPATLEMLQARIDENVVLLR